MNCPDHVEASDIPRLLHVLGVELRDSTCRALAVQADNAGSPALKLACVAIRALAEKAQLMRQYLELYNRLPASMLVNPAAVMLSGPTGTVET